MHRKNYCLRRHVKSICTQPEASTCTSIDARVPELKSSFLYTRDLVFFFFFQARSYAYSAKSGERAREREKSRSYRTVPRLIAACGKTQFSSRARRARADQILIPSCARRPEKDRGRIARAFTAYRRRRGRRKKEAFLEFSSRGKEPRFCRSRLGAFWHTSMEIRATVRTHI